MGHSLAASLRIGDAILLDRRRVIVRSVVISGDEVQVEFFDGTKHTFRKNDTIVSVDDPNVG